MSSFIRVWRCVPRQNLWRGIPKSSRGYLSFFAGVSCALLGQVLPASCVFPLIQSSGWILPFLHLQLSLHDYSVQQVEWHRKYLILPSSDLVEINFISDLLILKIFFHDQGIAGYSH